MGLAQTSGRRAHLGARTLPHIFELEQESLEHPLLPLSTVFVPIFFFRMGRQVDIAAILSFEALLLGLALSVAAIAGKMACAAIRLRVGSKPVVREGKDTENQMWQR